MGQIGVVHLERRLGSDRLDVRLGAIDALERVMIDSVSGHPAIVELLAAFVRECTPAAAPVPDPDAGGQPEQDPRPAADLQAAVTVLGRRPAGRAERGRVNLTRANLFYADLAGAVLADADLAGANLFHADLTLADLGCANLGGATLAGANLTLANLTLANLTDVDLTGANLTEADLDVSALTGAALTGEQQRAVNTPAPTWQPAPWWRRWRT
jgi:hypothetical protein